MPVIWPAARTRMPRARFGRIPLTTCVRRSRSHRYCLTGKGQVLTAPPVGDPGIANSSMQEILRVWIEEGMRRALEDGEGGGPT